MDEAEAVRLVENYSDLILRLSFTYLKSTHDAEDICQNVFLKYINAGTHFQDREQEKAWIIRTTINACKDVLKSAYRKKVITMDNVWENTLMEGQDSPVRDAVMQLPPNYRIAIYLHYFEGYPIKEIAKAMGKNKNAVTLYLSRGRRKLRETLKDFGKGRVMYYEEPLGR